MSGVVRRLLPPPRGRRIKNSFVFRTCRMDLTIKVGYERVSIVKGFHWEARTSFGRVTDRIIAVSATSRSFNSRQGSLLTGIIRHILTIVFVIRS